MRPLLWLVLVLSPLAACGSDHSASSVDAPGGADAPSNADAPPASVTFSYTPAWAGVQSVEVIGGFGLSSDWMAPLVTLTGSSGTFTGSALLPPGTYLYVLHVVGDADSTKQATYSRYAIDPATAGYAACPQASPTYNANEPNPCSQLAVPVGAAPALYHVTGRIVVNGAPAAGYLVLLEREEMQSHHFFANRVTTASDGTYDMVAATGKYRIQIQHPQYEMKTDSQIDPIATGTLRRNISASFDVSADVALGDTDMKFAGYTGFTPTNTSTLPTTLSFGLTSSTRADVYGGTTEIGDPWFNSTPTTTGSVSFTGMFNTNKAPPGGSVVLGTKYYWGIEQSHAGAGGVMWTAQSLVFPITWH